MKPSRLNKILKEIKSKLYSRALRNIELFQTSIKSKQLHMCKILLFKGLVDQEARERFHNKKRHTLAAKDA